VADFETKLRWLSERGNPVGAEELIERIEADLAGDPLVVVAKRREGRLMTKTQQPPATGQPSRNRGPAWAVAAFVAVLAVAALYIAFAGGEDEVADTPPPPTTVAPDVETMTDLEVIQTVVAAFYSGDGERAAELFELPDRTDDEIRGEAAYQAAIGGRVTLTALVRVSSGVFTCQTAYHNAATDAIGYVDEEYANRVTVEDGVITEFGFPEHSWLVASMGSFLATIGRFEGYEDCGFGPFPESCATIQLENLDGWVQWRESPDLTDVVKAALEPWYGGDCPAALFLSGRYGAIDECSTSSSSVQTIEYESILGAQVSVEGCEEIASSGDDTDLSCQVHYSNALNIAVGKPPSVTVRGFGINSEDGSVSQAGDGAWWEADYPEDTELRDSFQAFAEEGDLAEAYADAGCATARTPECANLILDNLDAWAAWYETNS
jgi:hypothetical protein